MGFFEKGDGGVYGEVSGIGTSYDAWGSANQIRDPGGSTWDRNVFGQFSPSKSSGWGSYHSSGGSDSRPSHFWILLLVWAVCGLIWLAVHEVQHYIAPSKDTYSILGMLTDKVQAGTSNPPNAPGSSAKPAAIHTTRYVEAVTLNLRAGPGSEEPIISQLAKGTQVTLTGETKSVADGGVWVQVIAGGHTGWVNRKFLR